MQIIFSIFSDSFQASSLLSAIRRFFAAAKPAHKQRQTVGESGKEKVCSMFFLFAASGAAAAAA